MPISPEIMRLYPGGSIRSAEWLAIRERIRERAGDRCEQCRVPNRTVITRSADGTAYYLEHQIRADYGTVFSARDGEEIASWVTRTNFDAGDRRPVEIVCTVAHFNHDVTDNRDENLKFWCQRCHNLHDMDKRQGNAARTRRSRFALGDLFDDLPACEPAGPQQHTVREDRNEKNPSC